eukprot:TRINITY_DN11118_c0_g1_i1.p1 TRINITY_DN11118_c0_g1~~TRINITY_DN11118_c0_g1_i1.p1  ORF type:complete len:172 (+),score=40.04 TRINITY_DN11118_c0_g1_i1:300-815(+)
MLAGASVLVRDACLAHDAALLAWVLRQMPWFVEKQLHLQAVVGVIQGCSWVSDMATISWLRQQMPLHSSYSPAFTWCDALQRGVIDAVRGSMQKGNMPMAAWVVETFGLSWEQVEDHDISNEEQTYQRLLWDYLQTGVPNAMQVDGQVVVKAESELAGGPTTSAAADSPLF